MFSRTLSYSISLILVNIFVHGISLAQGTRTEYEIRLLKESDRTKYIVLSAPADLSGVVEFKLPPVPGTVGQVLTINNEGKMEWATPAPAAIPPGAIMQFAGIANGTGTKPDGWLVCDGSAVSRIDYAALFEAIGTTYGGGDGESTFNLPDFRVKFPLGNDTSKVLGSSGGADSVQLIQENLPAHNHRFIQSAQGTNLAYSATVNWLGILPQGSALHHRIEPSGLNIKLLAEGSITKTGGDKPHNNMPPYIVVNYIIKY